MSRREKNTGAAEYTFPESGLQTGMSRRETIIGASEYTENGPGTMPSAGRMLTAN
jgi:hypothetical protein